MRHDEDQERALLLRRSDAALKLLPPRLLPLRSEQQVEAVELLSELLLEATRRSDHGSGATPRPEEATGDARRDDHGGEVRQGRLAA